MKNFTSLRGMAAMTLMRTGNLMVLFFVSPGANFDFSDFHEAADIRAGPPPCIDDHPAVLHAYIRAFISASFYNATHATVYHALEA